MKSKLSVITTLAVIASTGLPSKAVDKELKNRATIIAIMTIAKCHVNAGKATDEQANELLQKYLQEHPHALTAYEWFENSRNAKAAVEAMRPYYGPDCFGTSSGEEAQKELMPVLK